MAHKPWGATTPFDDGTGIAVGTVVGRRTARPLEYERKVVSVAPTTEVLGVGARLSTSPICCRPRRHDRDATLVPEPGPHLC